MSVKVSELVGPVLSKQGVDAVGEVRGDGAEGLVVVPAALDHQAAVQVCEVRIFLSRDVRGELEGPAKQVGAGLADRAALFGVPR